MKLNSDRFHRVTDKFGKPYIDFFASRINKQIDKCVSWHPEPDVVTLNAFFLTKNNNYFYMLIPICLAGRVLKKSTRTKLKSF